MSEIRSSIDDEDGRYRAVAEIEVPGTPEQIWELIATGPGIEAWFVPAEVEPGVGGRYLTRHGDFGDSEGVVTAWEAPHRLAYDEPDWQGPGIEVPVWNTEIVIEATSGSTCVVRLSSGFLAGGDAWRDDIDGTLAGWSGALRNLRLYLTHFAGLPATTLWIRQELPPGAPDVITAAGLREGGPGTPVATAAPAPTLAGTLEQRTDDSVVVRTAEPCPGIVEITTVRHEGTWVVLGWTLYGEDGPGVLDRERAAWASWLARQVTRTGG